jgi:hypothetical protein
MLEATVVRGTPTLILDLDVGLVVSLVPKQTKKKRGGCDEDDSADEETDNNTNNNNSSTPQLVALQHIEMAASGRRARILVRQLN